MVNVLVQELVSEALSFEVARIWKYLCASGCNALLDNSLIYSEYS